MPIYLPLEDSPFVVAFLAFSRRRLLDGSALQHAALVDPVLLRAALAVDVLRRPVQPPIDVTPLFPAGRDMRTFGSFWFTLYS